MRVLMIARPNLLAYPGGDTTQVLQTARALRDRGVEVDINPPVCEYRRYDLLHFFNIIDPEDILGHLGRSDRPYVVSTIYCRYDEYDRHHRTDLIGRLYRILTPDGVEYVKTVGKWLLKGEPLSSNSFLWLGHRGSIRRVLKGAACLLPNSLSEYRRLLADFGIERPFVVVPNAVDVTFFSTPEEPESRDAVLCVARIEGRKNHLNLIRAMNRLGRDIWLVGQPALNQPAYYRQCRRIAGANIHFAGYVSEAALKAHYRRARVHVLPSWFETTGLASLEAAVMGCNVVVADRGDVRDYFGDEAWYCDPADPVSIAEAVDAAYRSPFRSVLKERILAEFTWEKAAERTLAGYQLALSGKNKPSH